MKHTLLLIVCLAALGFFLTNFFTNTNREKDISQSSSLDRGTGWKNNKSLYSGGELGFTINGTENISFQFSTNSKADQGVEILIDDEKYVISSPNISRQKLTILVDKNNQHRVTIRHFCTYFYEPCDITLNNINVNKASKIQPFQLHEKAISVLGDSISTIYGKNNYTHLLANRLDFELHNASALGSTVSKVEGFDNAISRYEEDINRFKSSIIIVFIGGNDIAKNVSSEEFRSNYLKMIRSIKENNPSAKIYLTGILPRKDIEESALRDFNNAIRNTASITGNLFIDTAHWLESSDYEDGIHPSEKSQQKISDNFYSVLSSN